MYVGMEHGQIYERSPSNQRIERFLPFFSSAFTKLSFNCHTKMLGRFNELSCSICYNDLYTRIKCIIFHVHRCGVSFNGTRIEKFRQRASVELFGSVTKRDETLEEWIAVRI